MSFVKFLTSRAFFIQLFLAATIVSVFGFGMIKFLDFRTNHGQEITVPNLSKMKLDIASEKLNALDLEILLLDTTDFNKDFPSFAIIEQDPSAGSKVKTGRKIYVKINAGEYSTVNVPEFKDKTYRQIVATIKALGLKEGKITYKKHIAKDIVLQLYYNGVRVRAGDKIKKHSTLDFLLGDGKDVFDGENFKAEDTLINTEEDILFPEDVEGIDNNEENNEAEPINEEKENP